MSKVFLKIIFIGKTIFITQGCYNKEKNKSKKTISSKPVPPIDPKHVPPVDLKHVPLVDPIYLELKNIKENPLISPEKEQTLDNLIGYEGYKFDNNLSTFYDTALELLFGMKYEEFKKHRDNYKIFCKKVDDYTELFYIFIKSSFYNEINVEYKENKFTKFNDNIYYTSFMVVATSFKNYNGYKLDKKLIKFN